MDTRGQFVVLCIVSHSQVSFLLATTVLLNVKESWGMEPGNETLIHLSCR